MYTGVRLCHVPASSSVCVCVCVCVIIKLNWEEISFNWIAFEMNLAKNPWLRAPFIHGFCALLRQTLPSTSIYELSTNSHTQIHSRMHVCRQTKATPTKRLFIHNEQMKERTTERTNPTSKRAVSLSQSNSLPGCYSNIWIIERRTTHHLILLPYIDTCVHVWMCAQVMR